MQAFGGVKALVERTLHGPIKGPTTFRNLEHLVMGLLGKLRGKVRDRAATVVNRWLEPRVSYLFMKMLIRKTNNFGQLRWLGRPIWQNVFDLWTIQEVISDVRPELIIECGTNRGGSSYYYAQLCDLMEHGRIISMDIEKLHSMTHPRITYLIGDSCSPELVGKVRAEVEQCQGPVLVILDSDHSEAHVARELDAYHSFVTRGSYLMVQDGIIDVQKTFAKDRPGPLPAIEKFLARHPEFRLDQELCERFLITHHPKGWLRRI